jgi:hypothetical protein
MAVRVEHEIVPVTLVYLLLTGQVASFAVVVDGRRR